MPSSGQAVLPVLHTPVFPIFMVVKDPVWNEQEVYVDLSDGGALPKSVSDSKAGRSAFSFSPSSL